jgi:predicted RNase H-like HicB family nuclease
MRRVVLTPIEDGWWMAEVPSLPGCHTQAATKEEALEHIKDAIELHILTLQDIGKPVPAMS